MPIRSGIGIGEAQVYNTSGLANQYARQVATDAANLRKQALANQKRNEDFSKGIDAQVNSIKTLGNGLNTLDAYLITDAYQNVKDESAKFNENPNERTRALTDAAVSKKMNDLAVDINKAKQHRENLTTLANRVYANPEDYSDENKAIIAKLGGSSYAQAKELGYENLDANSSFQREPDFSSIDKSFKDVRGFVNQAAKANVDGYKDMPVGKGGKYINISSSIPEDLVSAHFTEQLASNNALKNSAKIRYKSIPGNEAKNPTNQDLGDFLTQGYKASEGDNAFRTSISTTLKPTPKEGTKQTETEKLLEVQTEYLQGAYNPRTANDYIERINKIAGETRAKLTRNPGGTITVEYQPVIEMKKDGMSIFVPNMQERRRKINAPDAASLMTILDNLDISLKKAPLMNKLIKKSTSTSQPAATNSNSTWAERRQAGTN